MPPKRTTWKGKGCQERESHIYIEPLGTQGLKEILATRRKRVSQGYNSRVPAERLLRIRGNQCKGLSFEELSQKVSPENAELSYDSTSQLRTFHSHLSHLPLCAPRVRGQNLQLATWERKDKRKRKNTVALNKAGQYPPEAW